jgi:carbon monoxide dehydrogenase subunit G
MLEVGAVNDSNTWHRRQRRAGELDRSEQLQSMYQIHVGITIDAPPQQVFDALTDHERFIRGPAVTCRLLAEGRDHRNGLGAVREATSEGMVFTEEITAFDPPRHFEYIVRRVIDPSGRLARFRHERGWLDVMSNGETTRVDWYSRFKVTMPIVGWFAERMIGPRAAAAFQQLLDQAKTELEGNLSSDPGVTGRSS